MNFLSLISNILPVTLAGLVLGAGIPALFALGMRLAAGVTDTRPDGTVVQTSQASGLARTVSWIIMAVIVAVVLAGILWIAKDFLHATTGFNFLGLAK